MLDDGSDGFGERLALQRGAEVGSAVEHDRFATADLAAEPRDDLDRFDGGTDRGFFGAGGKVERAPGQGKSTRHQHGDRAIAAEKRADDRARLFGARCRDAANRNSANGAVRRDAGAHPAPRTH